MSHRYQYLWVLVFPIVFGGCAGSPTVGESVAMETAASGANDSGVIIGEVSPPRERARVHTELAAAYYERGNLGVALEELRIAIAADAGYASAYNILGLVHMDLKELPQAQQSFQRALELAPNDPDVNHNYAWFLCQSKREKQSLKYFLTAIKNPLYRTPQKSYAVAGTCALRIGDQNSANDYFERALKLEPNFPLALISLAKIKYSAGELVAARDLMVRFNRIVEPSAESLWLALRIERRLGDSSAEARLASELGRRFPGSKEHDALVGGRYE